MGLIQGFDIHHWDKGDVKGKEAIEVRFNYQFPEGDEILFAYNERYGYEEECVVIWREPDGQIAMVRDSHCSCNDYEGGMARSGYPTPKQLAIADWGWITDDEARAYLQALITAWLTDTQPASQAAGREEG